MNNATGNPLTFATTTIVGDVSRIGRRFEPDSASRRRDVLNATEQTVCTRCVMDTSDPDITFDTDGVCNHCLQYENTERSGLLPEDLRVAELERVVRRIKQLGKGKEYDCILGISGGVDSSFVAYNAATLGLRPLAVHLDNGWNSELAVKNIENLLRTCGLELFTHVLDWGEFADMQVAYFEAGVVDIEMLTDHAITALLYRLAREHKIKHILSGNNIVTEAVMPKAWKHRKSDLRNIRDIHGRFGKCRATTYPTASTLRLEFYQRVGAIKTVNLLNYLDYAKQDAIELLRGELGWTDYGGKHYESVFTRFYQAHILPTKFGIDKRKAHLSTLVCSRQMSRDEALAGLQKPIYEPALLCEDKCFVAKKLGMSEAWLDEYLAMPGKSHYEYRTDEWIIRLKDRARQVRDRLRRA